MAALSPPRFFAAWRVEAPFSAVSLFDGLYNLRSLWHRCLTLQDAAPCHGKDSLYEYGRPHDTLSCLFFTALWLRQSQSILTQVQQTNDIDLTCYKTLPTKSVTCLQVGPLSLEWPVAPPAGSDQSSLSPSHEDPNDEHPDDALPAPPHSTLEARCSSTTSKYNEVAWIGTHVSIFLMAVFDVLLGILEVLLDLRLPHKFPGNRNITTPADLSKTSTSSAFTKYMGRTNFFGLFKCSHHVSNSLVRLHQTMQTQGCSAICIHKDLFPDDAVVTHVVTCQGRDHIVNVGSGCQSLVIVNVHFEPELTLRSLRERLRLITPHWPHYPDAIGTIMGDFNICEPEEGRFNVWNLTFTDGDTGKAALFHS